MRVQAIEMADFLVSWSVVSDSEGGLRWVVLVTDRGDGHATVFERRGKCGHVSWGDAQDIAAENARRVAATLIEPLAPLMASGAVQRRGHANH